MEYVFQGQGHSIFPAPSVDWICLFKRPDNYRDRGGSRGAYDLATAYTAQAQSAHQSLDSAPGNGNSLTVHLFPDLVGSVDLHIGVPDPLDLRDKFVIVLGPVTAQYRLAHLGSMTPVTRRGNLQNLADRLDPIGIAVLVDVRLQLLSRRSSSAWAKNALAVLRMSLARRSSLTSRCNALSCSRSLLVKPSRWPLSTSSRLTQSLSVCGTQPIFGAIDSIAAHSDGYSPRCSCTRRTARSRTCGENLFDLLFMAPSSQSLEPPQNTGRFKTRGDSLAVFLG